MAIVDFELPEEIKSTTYEFLLADMLAQIPNKYDKLEGGFVHDMIAPTALEVAELVQFWLPLALKTNFHMWAKGKWLDYHAAACGLSRRASTNSYGNLQITTTGRVAFPLGFVFSIPSEDNEPAIDFETTQAYSFGTAGTYTVRVKSVLTGKAQNVAANSISIMKNPVKNVGVINNAEAFTGGTEAETDDSLRKRIDDFYAGHGASFVGNKKDYERWAKEIAGVGYAHCIPTYAGENTVKLVIADSNGDAATPELCNQVKTYIFGTGHTDLKRLAPIGIVQYAVVPSTESEISINMSARLASDVTVSTVKKNIVTALKNYFKTLADDDNVFGTLRYTKVSAIISNVDGVVDFKNLKINGGTDNVDFAEDSIPTIENANVTISTY